jgi:hypothetical protein
MVQTELISLALGYLVQQALDSTCNIYIPHKLIELKVCTASLQMFKVNSKIRVLK